MKIADYHFGQITIDDRGYDRDVIVVPPQVVSPWWREQGHRLSRSDLAAVLEYGPETLVIGTGAYGAMKVPEEAKRALIDANVRVETFTTQVACDRFNALIADGWRVAAALHLTC